MAEKILIVDDDLDTLRLVGLMLQRQGYQIAAATNGTQGLAKADAEDPDLIVLDVMMPDLDGYEVARRLRQDPKTANTPILMFTAKTQLDDKVTGFEVGADDYLTKPTHPSELHAHVRALLARSKKTKSPIHTTQALEMKSMVIGLLAARGGMGVSTLALNLAAALATRTKADTILAEMVPGRGTLALDLGINDPRKLSELLSKNPTQINKEAVRDSLETHASGLRVLAASYHPRDCKLQENAAQYEMIVNRLAKMCRYLVLDLGAGLSPAALKILPLCHEQIVVIEGLPNPIQHSRALIDDMVESGIERRNILTVLNNRVRSEMQMPWNMVQEQLGHSIAVTFTPAPELHFHAARTKTVGILSQADSLTAQQFIKLATLITDRELQQK
jgi:DNA-binding response OmpR family regulator